MNAADRKASTDSLIAECRAVMASKEVDYASKEDTMANFKRNGAKTGLTKYQVWQVYFGKHIDSIDNAIKYHPQNPETETKSEPLRTRVIDAINYLTILVNLMDEDAKVDDAIVEMGDAARQLEDIMRLREDEGRRASDRF
jgi:hypothetical protein